MINLMYLVLTALLALNVSAEVMNAFFSLDKGMKSSSAIVEKSNEAVMKSINKQADAYKNPNNEKYRSAAQEAQTISNDFIAYVEQIRTNLFSKAGGPNPKNPEQPKDIRNKDLTTRMFINEGLGDQIKAKILDTRTKLLALADNDANVSTSLPLNIEELPAGTKAKNWSEFKFKQMPVAAIFPILGKMQSDAKNSTSAILNYCAVKVNGEDVKVDAFEPAVSAPKGYVIRGDKYEADVFLSAYSTTANNISISVDGSNLAVKEGKAHYETGTSTPGTKTYKVNCSVKNPLTGETKNYPKDFTYEVGERSCSVQLDKMNVFYIGVDNPISVAAAGVSSNDLKVTASAGLTLNSDGKSHYIVRAATPGEATITLSGGGLPATNFKYRVKRIPDPLPLLGAKHPNKTMGNGEFKVQPGVYPVLQNFDFEAKCDIVGFEVTYLPKRQDPITKTNAGSKWSSEVQDFINKAKPGDAYFFDEIKCKCPGDQAARNIGGLAYKIR
jgi:gliding motility-associated protein GldM